MTYAISSCAPSAPESSAALWAAARDSGDPSTPTRILFMVGLGTAKSRLLEQGSPSVQQRTRTFFLGCDAAPDMHRPTSVDGRTVAPATILQSIIQMRAYRPRAPL